VREMDYTQHPVVNGVEQQQQYSVTSLLGPILWHNLLICQIH